MWSSYVKCVAAWRERFGEARPDDRTLFHVEECKACHPPHRNGLDFRVLERADEWQVGLNSESRKTQAVRLEGLQLLELRENVDLGAHFADIDFEYDEVTEDGREPGLEEVIDRIGRRELHVGEVVVRAAPTTSRSWLKTGLSSQVGLILNECSACIGPLNINGGFCGVEFAREAGDGEGPPSLYPVAVSSRPAYV